MEPRYTPLAAVLLQKRIRIGEDRDHGLAQEIYCKDIVMLLQTFSFTADKAKMQNNTEMGRKVAETATEMTPCRHSTKLDTLSCRIEIFKSMKCPCV